MDFFHSVVSVTVEQDKLGTAISLNFRHIPYYRPMTFSPNSYFRKCDAVISGSDP